MQTPTFSRNTVCLALARVETHTLCTGPSASRPLGWHSRQAGFFSAPPPRAPEIPGGEEGGPGPSLSEPRHQRGLHAFLGTTPRIKGDITQARPIPLLTGGHRGPQDHRHESFVPGITGPSPRPNNPPTQRTPCRGRTLSYCWRLSDVGDDRHKPRTVPSASHRPAQLPFLYKIGA